MKVLIAGLGNMGRSHALSYHRHPDAEIVGLVNRSEPRLDPALGASPRFADYHEALAETAPDLVAIATYTETHADYAVAAMERGAHVFVEKPLAATMGDARRVVEAARSNGRKLVVGYILRHHPSWVRLISEARALGGPFVFRLNLNQRSEGDQWAVHRALMNATSPIVDCGVHYLDVMCQITDAAPTRVHGIGVRLSDEIAPDIYNYGHLHVTFADGSVGWYEAGWGPMMSETAHFVKDVVSPGGAVSIVAAVDGSDSSDVDSHTRVGALRVRPTGEPDRVIALPDEPGHQALCDAEAAFMLQAIRDDIDLDRHMEDALRSLHVCLAADRSIREGRAIDLADA